MNSAKLNFNIFSVILIVSFCFVLTFVSPLFAQQKRITIGTCGVQGYWYQSGTVLARILNKYATGVKAKAKPTACTSYNITAINKNELELGISVNFMDKLAYTGTEPFKSNMDISSLMLWYRNYMHIFTLNDEIKSLKDLEGKRVAVGVVGSGTRKTAIPILKSAGLEPGKNVDVLNVNLEAGIDMQKAGQADAQFWLMPKRNPGMTSLTETRKVYFIPVGQEQLQSLPSQVVDAYNVQNVPSNTYKHQKESVPMLSHLVTLLANPQLENDTVYNIVKAFFEHINEFYDSLPSTAKDISKDTALEGLLVPLHPGAEEYYKENNFPGLSSLHERVEKTNQLRK